MLGEVGVGWFGREYGIRKIQFEGIQALSTRAGSLPSRRGNQTRKEVYLPVEDGQCLGWTEVILVIPELQRLSSRAIVDLGRIHPGTNLVKSVVRNRTTRERERSVSAGNETCIAAAKLSNESSSEFWT